MNSEKMDYLDFVRNQIAIFYIILFSIKFLYGCNST